MRKYFLIPLIFCVALPLYANGPMGRTFGFGLVFGDPLGGTMKFWFNGNNALAISLGEDYFGSPRIGAYYLWHFDAFRSSIVNLYAGPGVAIGLGHGQGYLWYRVDHDTWVYRSGSEAGIAVRGIVGVNVVPRDAPIEIFFELGPLIGLTPLYGMGFDAALGIRFYP